MNPVNDVTTSSNINTLNPAEMSKQDFISAVYLERGEMLDTEVRRIIGEIDKSNEYVDAINSLIGKANLAEYGDNFYSSTTWQVNGNSVVLDNGYGLNVQPDGNGGSSVTIIDAEGNQLIYQNQTLIPVPAGTTVDALEVGIPVMNDMTFMLDDGTKITLQVSSPDEAFNQQNLSGGLANLQSIVITRDNQGMSIDNLDTASPRFNAPTVETPTDYGAPEQAPVKTETINIQSHSLATYFEDQDYNENYDFIGSDALTNFKNQWLPILDNKSPAEKEAMMAKLREQGNITIYYRLGDSDGEDNIYTNNYTYPVYSGDTLTTLINRVVDRSGPAFQRYCEDEEAGDIDIQYLDISVSIPSYSYESVIPDTDKTTSSMGSRNFSYDANYDEANDYDLLNGHANQVINEIKLNYLHALTPEQKEGLRRQLMNDGIEFDWYVEDDEAWPYAHDYYKSYTVKLVSGESVDDFLDRAATVAADRVSGWIRLDESESDIKIEDVELSVSVPAFSYDVYAQSDTPEEENTNNPRPINIHSRDANNNDGHILIETGGIHSWEYGGKALSALTEINPNDSSNQVTGYFARKLAFQNSKSDEFDGTSPLLTQKEIDLLTKILKIPYADASSNGQLTPEEWVDLKESLINARDNLNGNSQLQTVQLQRAMQTYNQNYEAMSNAQQKIYSLLRDIISNMK